MSKYVFDGRQLAGQIGGVQRYIYEVLSEFDKIIEKDSFEVVIPKNTGYVSPFKNLKIVEYGNKKGLLWEQLDFPKYLFKNHKQGIFLCSITSLLRPRGIIQIHDVMLAKVPLVKKSMKNPIIKGLLLLNFRFAAKYSKYVITDSECSKNDIIEIYKISPRKITKIGAGWEHIKRVERDDSWKNRFPQLKSGEFYFSLSANRAQKNFKWIQEVAKRNPGAYFAIAGTQEEWQKNVEYKADNIIHLGFLSDGEVRSLMENCKAFLFPSIYEGFGMPPMEAMAVGAKVIIAKASCLPEIYGKSAYYINPYKYDYDLDKLLEKRVEDSQKVLDRYSWKKSANQLLALLKKIDKKENRTNS